jgi:poly(hydroxyalkanoate) depolymerase family esterase
MNTNMVEVTRLTRSGRLSEAMALLRGHQGPTTSAGVSDGAAPDLKQSARIIDMVPPLARANGAWTAPVSGQTTSAAGAEQVLSGKLLQTAGMRELMEPSGGLGSKLSGLPQGLRPVPSTPIPEGARLEERSYVNQAGRRGYKLYVPSTYKGAPAPLIVLLHGCTQSPDDFAAGTRMNELAEEHGFIVAYPGQPSSANSSKCWNWFNAGDQSRDQGEPSLIAGITRQIMADFAIEECRVFVAGLSAGGAAAAIMGSAYPDLYAGVGIHSGLACGAAKDMASAFSAMRQGGSGLQLNQPAQRPLRGIVFHGDRDTTVNPVNGDQVIAQAKGATDLRIKVSKGQSASGVRYTRTNHSDEHGRVMLEQWVLHGAGHAWSGGSPAGSYTDPKGPDASREMVRFFLEQADPLS